MHNLVNIIQERRPKGKVSISVFDKEVTWFHGFGPFRTQPSKHVSGSLLQMKRALIFDSHHYDPTVGHLELRKNKNKLDFIEISKQTSWFVSNQ